MRKIIIILTTFFIFFFYNICSQKIGISLDNIEIENLESFENYFIVITGVIFTIIYSIIYFFGRKKAVEIFKKQFPEEKVIYVIRENELARSIITFAVGGACSMLVLVLSFEDIHSVGKISDFNALFYPNFYLFSSVSDTSLYNGIYYI